MRKILGVMMLTMMVTPAWAVTDQEATAQCRLVVQKNIQPDFLAYYDDNTESWHSFGTARARFLFIGCLRYLGKSVGPTSTE